MRISYSILTHNEDDSLLKLLEFLVEHKDEEDEIVILDDYSDNEKTKEILDTMCSIHDIKFEQRKSIEQVEESTELAPKFDQDGLIPVVATDFNSGEVLMQGYMNEVAFKKTISFGDAVYYSRSRKKS